MRRARIGLGSLVLVAVCAATWACGESVRTPSNPAMLANNEIEIVVNGQTCTVQPQTVIIDYPTDMGYKTKVKFKVKKGAFQTVEVVPAGSETDPTLFKLPKWAWYTSSGDKESKPERDPVWNGNGYRYHYKVKVGDKECDPDICIRQNGQGCIVLDPA